MFVKTVRFYDEEILSPCPTPKLEEKFLSAVRNHIFIIFEPTIHIGVHSSLPNPRTRHAVVTGTQLLWHRWEDNIKIDLQDVGCGCMNRIVLVQDRESWGALVNAVMYLRVP